LQRSQYYYIIKNDHVLLDNNIGFFAKSKNAESLIADIKKKLENSKQKIESLKDKIRVIDEMDNE
jgi:ABC-type Fe3+-hydroxamate transport system substrate-binding protein